MRAIILTLFIISNAMISEATTIKTSSESSNFTTFESILSADVEASEKLLRYYMEDTMNCSKVRMNLNILKKSGVFSKGIFSIDLTAECDNSITDVRVDFDTTCSRNTNGEAALLLDYRKNGQQIGKTFIVQNSQSCQE